MSPLGISVAGRMLPQALNPSYDFRCLLRRGPPLTIPNREVKPASADGTGKPGEYVDATFKIKSPTEMWGFFCAR